MGKLSSVFAVNLRKYRKLRGFTQADLANAIGVAPQTIFAYEAEKSGFTLDTVEKLAEALRIEETDLFATKVEAPPSNIQKPTVLDAIELVYGALGDLAAGEKLESIFGPDLPKLRRIAERRNRRKKTDPDKD